jgi:twinfilin-like protein
LKEIKEAEAIEAKRAALDPETEARRRKAVVALGGKMQWESGVEDALRKVAERSDDGWIVILVGHPHLLFEILS